MQNQPGYNFLKKPSLIFLLFCACFSFWFMDLWRPWHLHTKLESPFCWDVAHYYSYLPGTFNNDFTMVSNNEFDGFLLFAPDSTRMPKTTYGMAVLYSPFYALGYKIALNQKSPTDGYSEPFATCIHWGSIFYALLGFLLLRNLLVKFFSERATSFTLAVLFFGTNLFYYIVGVSEMTHGYLFMLISALLLTTYHWYKEITYKKTLLIGFLLGIIGLIRPTEVFVGLLFVFWMVGSVSELKERMKLLFSKWSHLLLILAIMIGLWIPQFIFWHYKTRHYFYFSYPGEGFFWTDPQIVNVLFSYRKGWFVYTPLIVLAFIGFFFMKDAVKPLRFWILGLVLVNIYMISCWWDWHFGGSFGARGFTQHYSYLSFPLTALIAFVLDNEKTYKLRSVVQLLFLVIVFSGICLNIGQTYQCNNGMLHPDGMNKKTYGLVFRKFRLSPKETTKYWGSLTQPDYDKMKKGERD
jgi:hypothetical protein